MIPQASFRPDEAAGYGVPAPCTACGAPMALTEASSLHSNPELTCRYCGHRESLPADAAERHRHLRLRLLQLTRAREAGEAPLRSFRAMNESWPIAIAFTSAMGLWQAWGSIRIWRANGITSVPQAVFSALPLAVALGMLSGWLGMRHVFAKHLRPLMRARSPQHPGLSARCRHCGGELPALRAPEVTCGFCGAVNLLDAALTTQAAALLSKEVQEYHQRMRPWARDPATYLAPSRAFYRYGAAGVALALLIATATLLLLL